MKMLRFLPALILFMGVTGCEKVNFRESNVIDVGKYIELLKSNSYDSLNLPAFSYKDIPALLIYRNETQIITDFPHNPVSSFWGPECKLGLYVLWTIESVRAVSNKSQYLILRFPSQNPVLGLRNSEGYFPVNDKKSHEIAAQAYFNWWENNKHKDFSEFRNIDPLGDTDYRWY